MQTKSRYDSIEYKSHDYARQFEERTKPGEERSPFEKDRSRIIHSAAFRRLQGKTQVFVSGSGDFFRTRLTHSLEVAQIGKALAQRLGADPDLVEACCLAHDLGHPPFGHTGEAVLNECMKDYGGFEGNAQNIRVLTRLSTKSLAYDGLNLTRSTLDGTFKYKRSFATGSKKFFYDEDAPLMVWATDGGVPGENSFDCQIMDWADEIAYSCHDLEDGMKAGMISRARLKANRRLRESLGEEETEWVLEKLAFVEEQLTERSRKGARKVLTSQLIHEFVGAAERELRPTALPTSTDRYRYRLAVDPVQYKHAVALKNIMFGLIVEDVRIATLENKATRIIRGLFDIFSDLNERTAFLFPEDFRDIWLEANDLGKVRTACDYIAGMTDDYAERVYARLYLPQAGSIYSL
ncbi:MAG: dNTP triphosphohydrolase [Chloroflexi bacterium]|nr:dNTP triphosphohydrolase [Chloroflexota bacterium]